MSIINEAVESVMNLIDALDLFAEITRGALGTKEGLCCEVGPSAPEEVYLDKNQYINLDVTINGKHDNLETLSNAMNTIHESLTMAKSYPFGTDWQIVDITTLTEPQTIGREANNTWLMASSLSVRVYTETASDEPLYPEYGGPYSVRSIPYEDQTLDTDGKLMTDDMTVEKVYIAETGNPQGDVTVYIGE